MSGGGGKGGSSTTVQEIPEWLKANAQETFNAAKQAASIGYMPYEGISAAALSPQQLNAMDQSQAWSNAFNMGGQNLTPDQQAILMQTPGRLSGAVDYMPAVQEVGGVKGYSNAPVYQDAVGNWRARYPGQAEAYSQMFVDPQTGGVAPIYRPPDPVEVVSDIAARETASGGGGGEGSDNAAERGGMDRGGFGGGDGRSGTMGLDGPGGSAGSGGRGDAEAAGANDGPDAGGSF